MAGLYLAWTRGAIYFWVLFIMSLLGISYNQSIFPSLISNLSGQRISRIKDVPASKTVLIAAAWGIVTTLLPAVSCSCSWVLTFVSFLFATGIVFSRTAFVDILAIQGDRIAGKETLPILIGRSKSLKLIRYTLGGTMVLPGILALVRPNLTAALALIPIFMFFLINQFKKHNDVSADLYEFLFESSLLLAGVIAVVS